MSQSDFKGALRKDILEKLYSFCAYQERCEQEVKQKLRRLEIEDRFHDEYIQHLQSENFLNEERYVTSFVRSKLNGNKWGKRKIELRLEQKEIHPQLIQQVLSEISSDQYLTLAVELASKKINSISESNPWKRKQKVYNFLAQKGFEPQVIQSVLQELHI